MHLKTDILTKKNKHSTKKRKITSNSIFILAVIVPSLAAYLLFTLYPNILSMWYSLLEWNGVSKHPKFVGIYNFVQIIKDEFLWKSLRNNLILMLTIPPIIILFSLVIADMLTNRVYKEGKLYKVIFFFPNVLSTVIIGVVWIFIFDGSSGLLNAVLKILGIDMQGFYWLGDVRTSLFSVILVMIWSSVGFYIVIYMNAMITIPASLYESAIIEGITNRQRLFKITLPLIMSIVRVSFIFITIVLMKSFELIMIMTRGGPSGSSDVVGLYMYSYVFSTYRGGNGTNYGYASAIGMLIFVILVGLKLIIDKVFANDDVQF